MKMNEVESKPSKSGIIPYIKIGEDIKVCFMIPSDPKYGGYSPQLAKGNIEPNLSDLENAIKEGSEELGLRTDLFKAKPWLVSKYTMKEKRYFTVFAVEVSSQDFDKPHFETGQVLWLSISEAFKKIRPDQKGIFGIFWREVKKK